MNNPISSNDDPIGELIERIEANKPFLAPFVAAFQHIGEQLDHTTDLETLGGLHAELDSTINRANAEGLSETLIDQLVNLTYGAQSELEKHGLDTIPGIDSLHEHVSAYQQGKVPFEPVEKNSFYPQQQVPSPALPEDIRAQALNVARQCYSLGDGTIRGSIALGAEQLLTDDRVRIQTGENPADVETRLHNPHTEEGLHLIREECALEQVTDTLRTMLEENGINPDIHERDIEAIMEEAHENALGKPRPQDGPRVVLDR